MASKRNSVQFLVVVMLIYIKQGNSLDCIGCDWDSSNPTDASSCYDYTGQSIDSPTFPCTYPSPYCLTEFTFTDGILTSLSRSCINGLLDQDTSTDEKPTSEKCVSQFNPGSPETETTKCYLACDDDDSCNGQKPANLKTCPSSCGLFGVCNYITGTCTCEEGYMGDTCTTAEGPEQIARRSCVQCDSETDATCQSRTASTECQNTAQRYCAVSKVTTLNQDLNVVRTFVSRSCSETYAAADECFITSQDSVGLDGIEYTCVSTCDTNGCNTGIPDGTEASGNEMQPIRCVVCDESDSSESCILKTSTDVCPSSSTHCVSKATYFISEKTDISHDAEPEFLFKNIVRSCSSDAVEKKCTQNSVQGMSLQEVTCEESCKEDGCNTGWPNRPKCSQCACSQCNPNDACLSNPPPPVSCGHPFHNYCVIEDMNRDINKNDMSNGYPRNITRRCSHISVGNTCSKTQYSDKVENCYKTCTDDGCNLGFSPYPEVTTIKDSSSMIRPNLVLIHIILIAVARFLFWN